jgi:hypothetical protein
MATQSKKGERIDAISKWNQYSVQLQIEVIYIIHSATIPTTDNPTNSGNRLESNLKTLCHLHSQMSKICYLLSPNYGPQPPVSSDVPESLEISTTVAAASISSAVNAVILFSEGKELSKPIANNSGIPHRTAT